MPPRVRDAPCCSTSNASAVLPDGFLFDTSQQTVECVAVRNVIDRLAREIQLPTDDRVPFVSDACGYSPQPVNAVAHVGQVLKNGAQGRFATAFRLPPPPALPYSP